MSETTGILLLVFGTFLFTLFAVFIILYIALQKKKQYHYQIEKQEMQHRFNNELMRSRMEVHEQTLKDLSAELHDNVAQMLGMAKMQLHMLSSKVIDNPSREMVAETTLLVGEVIKDIRSMSHTMNGNYILKAGLKESIEKDLQRIRTATRIKCNFMETGDTFTISEDRQVMLFRIVQECIANAVKHGEPYSIYVSLKYYPDALQVTIVDDGKGFHPDNNTNTGGLGLDNIKERIRLLKGTMSINSEENKGTTVLLRIPS